MPHYCLTDINKVKENMQQHAKRVYEEQTYLEELISAHPIVALTIRKAIEYASTHKVLRDRPHLY